jgi:predicted O-methyltransferase YrrM
VTTSEQWTAVDDWFASSLAPGDEALEAALAASAAAGLPPYQVSPLQGKLLELLIRSAGASRVLEIGTLGGYSTIWMPRALAERPGARLVTIERDERHARVARANIERAGLGAVVELEIGAALDVLPTLGNRAPFDLVFIDADKVNSASYVRAALSLSRPGAVIVLDNVVRGGAVLDQDGADPSVVGVRAAIELMASDPRVSATALQTVGSKGYDGFAMAVVLTADPSRSR